MRVTIEAGFPYRFGAMTEGVLEGYRSASCVSAAAAAQELAAEMVPFNERLSLFVAQRLGIPDDPKSVRRALRAASERKGLGLSSANLSQWVSSPKGEVTLSPKSVFKLCVALDLDLVEAEHFVFDCLYQDWFNFRDREQCVYGLCLGMKDVLGQNVFQVAKELLREEPAAYGEPSFAPSDATGCTRLIGRGLRDLAGRDYASQEEAVFWMRAYLDECAPLFSGVRLSTVRCYRTYFDEGGVGITPLVELYQRRTGLVLPSASYLDMTDACGLPQKKRLLWGAAGRAAWVERNGRDWDILHESTIRTERHAVERMARTGYLRGNIVALLFFHCCFENAFLERNAFPGGDDLFARFYETTNLILIDECGMAPLHPRKPFDRLFLAALSKRGGQNPVHYLNEVLEQFYAS
ncbi:hypothetical protein [Xiamenia xianingshaonis]|uniref:hypothetical protein n=1 Tax=Xiamenia xianingshaonis TaxID=2682776 RepID=UPI00140ADD96|nr:hypothetical protein [Xiamenia xianingshaonis]